MKKRIFSIIICSVLCFSLLTGCNKKNEKTTADTAKTEVTAETLMEEDVQSEVTQPSMKEIKNEDVIDTESEETMTAVQEKEIEVYTINDESLDSEPETVVLQDDVITAEVIVNAVVESFAGRNIEIGIDSISEEGDAVIVSFMKDKPPIANIGSSVEDTILNCIADSLLDNLESCKNVIFRCEGEAYESGHFYFEKDEVYTSE